MIDILKLFAALALGYLLGSLNTAVIVGKIYGKDIRSHGSKKEQVRQDTGLLALQFG